MDERSIKRMAIMVAVSIIVIMLLKAALLKTAIKVNAAREDKVAMEKAKAAAPPPEPMAPPAALPESAPTVAPLPDAAGSEIAGASAPAASAVY